MADRTIGYVLAVLVAAAAMLNLSVGIWRSVRRGAAMVMPVRVALILTDLGHVCNAMAMMMLLLNHDAGFDGMCAAGGFMLIFATLSTLWTLTVSIGTILLWQKGVITTDGKHANVRTYTTLVTCSVAAIWLLAAVLTFIPLFKPYAIANSPYAYGCLPVRQPGQVDWPHTLVELVLVVAAVVACAAELVCVSVRARRQKMAGSSRRLLLRLRAGAILDVCAWSIAVLSAAIVALSPSANLDVSALQWTVGFLVAIGHIARVVVPPTLTWLLTGNRFIDQQTDIIFKPGALPPGSVFDVENLGNQSDVSSSNEFQWVS